MTGRGRNRTVLSFTGNTQAYFHGSLTSSSTQNFNNFDQMSDSIDSKPYPDHALSASQQRFKGAYGLNGTLVDGSFSTDFQNWPNGTSLPPSGHLATNVAAPSPFDYNRLLARTNPSSPTISPLELIQDFVDLPKMLRDVGKWITKPKSLMSPAELASYHLSAQFGWFPLINDVKSIIDLGQSVSRKARVLHRLYEKGGLHASMLLDHDTAYLDGGTFRATGTFGGPYVVVHRHTYTTVRKWGTVRWKPTSLPPWAATDEGILQKARELAGGLTVEGILRGSWAVIPWTWLTDWFGHTGDFLASFSNSVPAEPQNINIMMHSFTETFENCDIQPFTTVKWDNGSATLDSKVRTIGASGLVASLPFITPQRLSILGSLFVQRFKGL